MSALRLYRSSMIGSKSCCTWQSSLTIPKSSIIKWSCVFSFRKKFVSRPSRCTSFRFSMSMFIVKYCTFQRSFKLCYQVTSEVGLSCSCWYGNDVHHFACDVNPSCRLGCKAGLYPHCHVRFNFFHCGSQTEVGILYMTLYAVVPLVSRSYWSMICMPSRSVSCAN